MSEQESRLEGILGNDISNSKVNVLGIQQKVPQSRLERMLGDKFEEIDQEMEAFVGGVKFQGSVTFSNLPATGMSKGDMYNISDNFTTTNAFREGSGIFCPAGTNIVYDGMYWDIFTPVSNTFVRDITAGNNQALLGYDYYIVEDDSRDGYTKSVTIPWPGVTEKDLVNLNYLNNITAYGLVVPDMAVESLENTVKIYLSDWFKYLFNAGASGYQLTRLSTGGADFRIWLTKVQEYA